MADSVRLAALKNLVTTMEGITVANGYATTVQTVLKEFVDWETGPPRGTLPMIGVVPLAASYEYISARTTSCVGVRISQEVAVEFVYAATTQDIAWQTGDEMADDIIAAASVDRTRGGNALDTRVASVETDAGNADTMDSRGGVAAGIVRLTLDIVRSLGVS
ncbi:MAG: hypothetical protein GWN29_04935 [Gammaproteobacteria bacterium]|nr:hypothetical protein [Gammaproteobacteria bacterium]NIV51099.1 hypothetical protein [Gammaproteobacteria bacterium]NIW23951.1 hypothetical protein [Gammaproteobacteria bacterium]NIX85041.1 hypothetical protein [Gammaproteobacteria bacterium]